MADMSSLDPSVRPALGHDLAVLAERVARRQPATLAVRASARAAVAILLVEAADGLRVLLIRRATRLGDPWSGHVGLPGGRTSPLDTSLRDTAMRETLEEVGYPLAEKGQLLGQLDDRQAMTRGLTAPLVISPFLFAVDAAVPLRLAPAEVEEAFWVPIWDLRAETNQVTWSPDEPGTPASFPAVKVGRHVVWGLTLRMLRDVFPLLDGATPRSP